MLKDSRMRISVRSTSNKEQNEVLDRVNEVTRLQPQLINVCRDNCSFSDSSPCSRDCDKAPAMLSSDGDEYPLDIKIAPLVFELKRMGFYTPCWSCEGHLGPDGKVWKLPRVWFYTTSDVYVRLLNDAIQCFAFSQILNALWEIKLVAIADASFDTMYSLEPAAQNEEHNLLKLQDDISLLSLNLFRLVTSRAYELNEKLR